MECGDSYFRYRSVKVTSRMEITHNEKLWILLSKSNGHTSWVFWHRQSWKYLTHQPTVVGKQVFRPKSLRFYGNTCYKKCAFVKPQIWYIWSLHPLLMSIIVERIQPSFRPVYLFILILKLDAAWIRTNSIEAVSAVHVLISKVTPHRTRSFRVSPLLRGIDQFIIHSAVVFVLRIISGTIKQGLLADTLTISMPRCRF